VVKVGVGQGKACNPYLAQQQPPTAHDDNKVVNG